MILLLVSRGADEKLEQAQRTKSRSHDQDLEPTIRRPSAVTCVARWGLCKIGFRFAMPGWTLPLGRFYPLARGSWSRCALPSELVLVVPGSSSPATHTVFRTLSSLSLALSLSLCSDACVAWLVRSPSSQFPYSFSPLHYQLPSQSLSPLVSSRQLDSTFRPNKKQT